MKTRPLLYRILVVTTAFTPFVTVPAWAQTTSTDAPAQSNATAPAPETASPSTSDVEDIIVTGTRASLARALDIKRSSNQIVDAISAEDLGKFPDKNVAESLQHVPGVSIDRTDASGTSDGEGRTITVRGFGPQFNTVLLNNRLIATDQSTRSFSFDILASELITSAEVYKSANAVQQDGGIGSTVVLRTARPTDRAGLHGALSVAGRKNSTGDRLTPEASGLISLSNEDRTFGVLASFNYSKRQDNFKVLETAGWIAAPLTSLTAKNISGIPAGRSTIYFPRSYGVGVVDYSRRRYGGTFAVDYAPSDHIKIKLDALYSSIKTYSVLDEVGFWNAPDHDDNIVVNERGTVTHFTVNPDGNLHSDMSHRSTPENRYTMQFGANVAYDSLDGDTISVDLSHSKARLKSQFINDIPGLSNPGATATFDLNAGGIPTFTGYLPTTDASRAYFHCCGAAASDVGDQIWELNLDGQHKFDGGGLLSSLKYGLLGTRRIKTSDSYTTPTDVSCFYCGYFVQAPSSIFQTIAPGSIFGQNISWLTFNHAALMAAEADPAAIAAAVASGKRNAASAAAFQSVFGALGNDNTPLLNRGNSNEVRELTGAAYMQAEFKGDFGLGSWVGVLGGRYVYTDVLSEGFGVELLNLVADPAQPGRLTATLSNPQALSLKSHYGYFLPSATFRWNVTPKLEILAAVSRTLTRPDPGQLTVGRSFGFDPPQPSVSGGNPNLKPILAWNGDLGINYYINKASYLSVAGFYKDIRNFISSGTTHVDLFGYDFLFNTSLNANRSKVYGFEATAQLSFAGILPAPFDGFGVSANYTKVNSTSSFDPTLSDQVFNIEGLSDSANVIAYYEKGPFQIRAAYNWRAPFLRNTFGDNGLPTNVGQRNQIDLRASLQATKNFNVFADVVNLTNEKEYTYSSYKERFTAMRETGRFISAGARFTF